MRRRRHVAGETMSWQDLCELPGWRISDSIDFSNIHVADQVDRVYVGGDTIRRIWQLTGEQLWDRTGTVQEEAPEETLTQSSSNESGLMPMSS